MAGGATLWYSSAATLSAIAVAAPVQDNRPWERLADGRLVIEIKGNRVALHPAILEEPDASVRFVPERTPSARDLTFREVVQNPAVARTEFARWARVVLRTGNSRIARGRFLGKYDRQLVPSSNRVELTFWDDPQGMLCRSITSIAGTSNDCHKFNELAEDASNADKDGVIVVRYPKNKPPRTIYILPKSARASANGEAIFFSCGDVLPFCRNNAIHFYGYAVKKSVSLYYEFSYKEYPKERMRDLARQMMELVDDIFLPRR